MSRNGSRVGETASTATLFVLNAYWVGLSFMWNSLHPIVLPALLVTLVPEGSKNTYLGLLTFAGLVIAMILQPVSGSLSDRWTSPYGRRRPLIVMGTVLDCLFLTILGLGGGFTWIAVGYLGLQISSNVAQAPLQGLMRDRVPPQQLGVASSVKIFLDLATLVIAAFVAGQLMAAGNGGTPVVILVIMGLLLLCGAITVLFTHEEPGTTARGRAQFRASLQSVNGRGDHRDYWWLIAERGTFLLGVYGLQAFGQYYLRDALEVPNPPEQAGNLLGIIGLATVAFVVAGGRLSDRFGPKTMLYAASGLGGFGMLLLVLTGDLRGLYIVGSIIGAGIGLFLTSNWALANSLAPPARAGHYLGLTNLATAGAAAISRLQGPAVDFLNAAQPEAWWGYKGVFLLGALCILISTWFLSRVR